MTHSSRWLLVLGFLVIACGAMTYLYAQDDLEALLQDLGGQKKKTAEVAPAPAPVPAVAEKPAVPVPAPVPAVAEKPAAPAPAPVPAVAEKPATPAPAPVVAEKPVAVAPAPVPAPAVAEKPAAPAPAPVVAEKPAEQPAAPAPAPAVAEKPAAPAPAVAAQSELENNSLVSELLTLEKIRRKSLDDHGYASLSVARKAMKEADYPLAREQYKQALDFIGSRPDTLAAIEEARQGMAEAFYREAKQFMKKGDYEKALPLAVQAQERGHPQASRLVDTLKKDPGKIEMDSSSIAHRVNEEEYKAQRDDIRRLLRRSRQFYTTGEYDKALEECELILRDYPQNTEAMELRDKIADRLKTVADVELEATRSLMIRDVRKAWSPERYAIESSQMPKGKSEMTSKRPVSEISGTKTSEQVIQQKLRDIVIPEVTFRPPATIIDAVDFFKQASRDYDKPDIPVEQRGVNLVLKLAAGSSSAAAPAAAEPAAAADPFAAAAPTTAPGGVPQIQALSARFINLYDALKLVCDVTGMKFRIRGNIVMIVPSNDPDDELVTRSYNVLATLQERVGAAQSELSQNQGAGGENTFMQTKNMESKQDWKTFFQQMGVKWPEGSSISYMATIGKLRVTNTAEQLAVFEQVLEDLNVTPRLIEIEARFVEVSQKDLNSLGFEWLLNSDFSFDAGGFLDKALNLKEHSNKTVDALTVDGQPTGVDVYQPYQQNGQLGVQRTVYIDPANPSLGTAGYVLNNGQYVNANSLPAAGQYGLVNAPNHNASMNAIDGVNYSTGQRYLNTVGNPISGEGGSVNDQFMRVNAFLGNADLSMILHMLSQRSDTDLLYAPKVVTKSGQEAIMKVVTEYIYPTEYEVQISQQSTSGGSGSSGGTADPLAIVEPQNFEMREVGMILQVVPEVSSEGQMINLMLNPQVVSEPIWKNYGTRVPKTTYRAPTMAERADMLASGIFSAQIAETSYIELPMEQPFFHVRSVQTQLSVYNGATVVMGGLITEARKTMEDKIPYLGDLPYIGRFFRSRSEESDKRNLLVFVTARLVDPAGRSVRTSGGESALMSGGGAPLQQQAPAAAPAPEAAAAAAPAAAAQ